MNRLQGSNGQQNPEPSTLQLAQATAMLDELPSFIYVLGLNTDEILAANNATRNFYQDPLVGENYCSILYGFNDPCVFYHNKIILQRKRQQFIREYHGRPSTGFF